MNKLNNKGFSLVELLAVIVVLSILSAISIPSINSLIKKNQQDSYNSLKKSIISAAKVYISDNRYNISLSGTCNSSNERSISQINGNSSMFLSTNKLKIQALIEANDLNNGKSTIVNPQDNTKKLNLNESYIVVKYNCNTKDYNYNIEDDYLVWE